MNTSMSMRISICILTATSIFTRTRNIAMSIPTRMIMNTRISTAMNMTTKAKPMFTLMGIRANTDLMTIGILGTRKTSTSINR